MGDGPRDWRPRTATNVGQRSVYKRKDGRWVAQIALDGKRHYLYAKTRTEARKRLSDAIRAAEDGRPHAAKRVTVAELLDAWLEVKTPDVAPTTASLYAYSARVLAQTIGPLPIAQLDTHTVERTYAQLEKTRAPDTVHTIAGVFALAIKTALRWGWLPTNPLDGVKPPRPGRPKQSPLTVEEVRTLLDVSAIDRYHALWRLLVSTGCTIGEATALSWRHVDLEAQTISIERVCTTIEGATTIRETTKTQARCRRVTLPDETTASLKAHRSHQLRERLTHEPDWNPQDLVFCTQKGAPVSNNNARYAFSCALQRGNIPHIRLHDLRHTAATLLLAAGVHPKVVQEKLGHSSIAMTLNRYSHVMESSHREADDRMNNLLSLPQPANADAVSGAVTGAGRSRNIGAR